MDTTEILKAQRAYFESGATRGLAFRQDALTRLLKAFTANEKMLLDALRADLGKSGAEGYMTEVGLCREELRFALGHLSGWARSRRVRTPLAHFKSASFIQPEPYGAALIISPWNYPLLLTVEPLIGALAAGNCATLKPSRNAPATAAALADMLGGLFPPEYVAVVRGGRAESGGLVEQKYDYIFFTGSAAAGREIMAAAAKNLTPVSLELGGKSPVIIDGTAAIALTAKRLAFGKLINAGQTCVAPDYVYVHADKKKALIRALDRTIAEFYPKGAGDENLPRIVNEKHFDRLTGLLAGETAVIGGAGDRGTLKLAPTVLDGVTEDAPVMREEIFGPILPLLAYTDIDEVIAKIRSRPKPLALYLFSEDRAVQKRVLRELSFGGGCINDTLVHIGTPYLGFGGVGESGMGAYHGRRSFDTFSHYKSILDKKTWLDLPIRYPPFTAKKEKLLRMILK
ncbi:aldehyde dehydrogenase (NAD+) [Sporobacter termitidis DSM 10068]|uniref:Aldehyde dehydrogenase n=1 Tax=Sporobacter termitidis DSM 10068 TaxID=1123282 RepID=A0A1M5WGE0_9FIRM|nr:aldehyde dehydrogenase [Sporobacter termitidis]SHH86619.1 aldehyde dehydrogenase (NAD+) [Sporobacter termitidis DSM 10068]